MSSLLSEIRAFTEGCHSELETKFDIFNSIQDQADYCALLARLHGLYSRLESALEPWSDEFVDLGLDYDKRKKLNLLTNDLRHFGWNSLTSFGDDFSLRIETFPQAVGCLYVLEGSTLGGQVISKHLKSKLQLNEDGTGLSFYQSYGSSTGQMWRNFCESLSRYSERLTDANLRQEVLISAKNTFAFVQRFLCPDCAGSSSQGAAPKI